ncbi:hypothetical protein CH289_07905 [Rhodococcus sp. RS1C4]|nr:hypothetical protein CH289_07905 [Rhodococcus sp. RS1C4]
MTADQMTELLQKIQIIDNRQLDRLVLSQWLEAAHDASWTADEAHAALRYHRAQSTEYLVPAHLTKIIRERRRQPAPVGTLAITRGNPASEDRRNQVMALVRNGFNKPRALISQTSEAKTRE